MNLQCLYHVVIIPDCSSGDVASSILMLIMFDKVLPTAFHRFSVKQYCPSTTLKLRSHLVTRFEVLYQYVKKLYLKSRQFVSSLFH